MKTRTRHISFITALAVLFFTAIAISTPMRSAAELSAEKGFILIKSKVGDETVEGIKWKVFAIGAGDHRRILSSSRADISQSRLILRSWLLQAAVLLSMI